MRMLPLLAASMLLVRPAFANTIVLTGDDWCPYNCAAGDADPGYAVEIVKKIFEPKGHTVQYAVRPWVRALKETVSGEATAIVGVTDEPETASLVMPNATIGSITMTFYTLPEQTWTYQGPESLAAVKLAVVRDYAYGKDLDAYIAANADKVVTTHGDTPLLANLRKLKMGDAGAVVDDVSVVRYFSRKSNLDVRAAGALNAAVLARVGFSKADPMSPQYAAAFDEGVAALRASGELAKILERYGLTDWQR